MMKKLLLTLGLCMTSLLQAQTNFATKDHGFVHESSKNYEWPTDQAVLNKLDNWQDLKFGIMIHWGIYSVPGITESWELSSEDKWFSKRRIERFPNLSYGDFQKWYWNLNKSFNPLKFEPTQWAKIMKDAGFKYLIFTTKHHDGFCMYDSKFTDYKVTNSPYKNGKYSNITYHLFKAFRDQGFMIGAYFSKPDWHNQNFWDSHYATPTRNPNYDVQKYPEKWAKFQEFTANQIDELMSDYGRIDMLWLDGGWVRKPQLDIKIDQIIDAARKKQPGLIAVDRTVSGRNENYTTPELMIPKVQDNHPWESCITLSNTWGWNPQPKYKAAATVINILAEITAKGGCLALNVGPTGEGVIEEEALIRLKQIGAWLKTNGTAIYGTRTTSRYNDGNVWFTANKDKKTLYAIYALPEGSKLPSSIEWEGNIPTGKMILLQNNRQVKYSCKNGKVIVKLPKGVKEESLAFCFKVK